MQNKVIVRWWGSNITIIQRLQNIKSYIPPHRRRIRPWRVKSCWTNRKGRGSISWRERERKLLNIYIINLLWKKAKSPLPFCYKRDFSCQAMIGHLSNLELMFGTLMQKKSVSFLQMHLNDIISGANKPKKIGAVVIFNITKYNPFDRLYKGI